MLQRNFLREIAGAIYFRVVFGLQISFVSCVFSRPMTSARVIALLLQESSHDIDKSQCIAKKILAFLLVVGGASQKQSFFVRIFFCGERFVQNFPARRKQKSAGLGRPVDSAHEQLKRL
jgi:hypothetical protein